LGSIDTHDQRTSLLLVLWLQSLLSLLSLLLLLLLLLLEW